ncbi:hypothetical protein P5704_024750 (plasmid) [Pseudomonas sp. FeN3W]|nr:hypothetical protein P5704_024750 [Pseudomonas sp. FeN3W]
MKSNVIKNAKVTDLGSDDEIEITQEDFTTIVNMMMFYEKSQMWDWLSELNGMLEEIDPMTRLIWLSHDLGERDPEILCKEVHTRLWWVLINERNDEVISELKQYLKSADGKGLRHVMGLWLSMMGEDDNADDRPPTEINIIELLEA